LFFYFVVTCHLEDQVVIYVRPRDLAISGVQTTVRTNLAWCYKRLATTFSQTSFSKQSNEVNSVQF